MKLLHKSALSERLCIRREDARRACTGAPYLAGDSLLSTNGSALAVIPIDRQSRDSDGYLPVKILQAIRRADWSANPRILLTRSSAEFDGLRVQRPDLGPFVDWERFRREGPPEKAPDLILDTHHLASLSAAVGSRYLQIWIEGPRVQVRPLGGEPGPYGFLRMLEKR